MNRREALAGLAGSLGYLVTGATLAGIAQGCKRDESSVEISPETVFFTAGEMVFLTRIVDIILPKTDTPSASEVGVPQFIDQFALEVMDDKKGAEIKTAMADVLGGAQAVSGKTESKDITDEQLKEALVSELEKKKSEAAKLRSLVILAYKSSELVGTKVLAYLPVPGEYIPCGDVEELTEGKAWSL